LVQFVNLTGLVTTHGCFFASFGRFKVTEMSRKKVRQQFIDILLSMVLLNYERKQMTTDSLKQRPLYLSAIQALQTGQFESAKQNLLKLLQDIGPDISIFMPLGVAYSRSGDMPNCF
jgi:hypothetical protein